MTSNYIAVAIGVALALSAELYYIFKIYQRKVRLSLSGFLVFFLSALLGGGATVSTSGVVAGVVPLSFATFQLWMLYAAYTTKFNSGWDFVDTVFIGAAVISGAVWFTFDLAMVALGCSLIIDAISYLLMIRKMFKYPATEDPVAWGLALASYSTPLVVALRVGNWQLSMYALALLNAMGCFLVIFIDLTQKLRARQA